MALDCIREFVGCSVISPKTLNQSEQLKTLLEDEIRELESTPPEVAA
jgi:hypothetical protein